ncbi:Tad domain-containing protein [Marimonas sp. MJW-29]|uniref:Tad domain-containing protein n=1 Tax=Sulfitobacter sediminis TaxID=3234186 RepID=A0ABV3RSL2_9RHOB
MMLNTSHKHQDRPHWTTDEDGSATILSLFFLLICLVMGGIAIDFNKAMSERTRLQVAADAAAHAALYTRETKTTGEARQVALDTVASMLPENKFGRSALTSADIIFGKWDPETQTFTANEGSRSAVKVSAQMVEDRNNASRNILLRMIGFDTFNIGVDSIYTTYYPGCFTEGFVSEQIVDIQSNNSFTDGFCIHSNTYVSLNQNNYFEPGTVVSMPNINDLDIPESGFKLNEGLGTALREGKYRMRLLSKLPGIIDSFWGAEQDHLPPYVDHGYAYNIEFDQFPGLPLNEEPPKKKYTMSVIPYHFAPNAVNRKYCFGKSSITLEAGLYSSFLLITDCKVNFANGVVLEDVVIATTSEDISSFYSGQGLQLGRDDNCAEGGGVTLMTLGGFKAAASLSAFNAQILAMKDIEFAAKADGVVGASFVSNGRIDGTSNMSMGYCKNRGMENAFRAPYFRMVK